MNKPFSKKCMEFTEFLFGEMKLIFPLNNIFNSVLMVEDHLCFFFFLSYCLFIVLDENLSIKIGVSISFHMTRCIGEINEKILDSPPVFHVVECRHRLSTSYCLIENFSICSEKPRGIWNI